MMLSLAEAPVADVRVARVSTPESLARRAQEGDELAFTQLCDLLAPDLRRFFFARNLGLVADELVDDTLLKLYATLAAVDPARVRSWAFGLAANLCRTARRSAHRERVRMERAVERVATTPPARSDWVAEAHDLLEAVTRVARSHLNAAQRETLEMFMEGLSTAAIAEETTVAEPTVRSRLCKTRAILRRHLAPYLELRAN